MNEGNIQELLDKEAELANTGKGESIERAEIHALIKTVRVETMRPICFGQDDCSTYFLMRCPWRIDCGD